MDDLKKQLDALRPLSPDQVFALKSVYEADAYRFIYESNAIEGNSLTLRETQMVLEKGFTIADKPLKDHLEAVNHQAAWSRLLDLVQTRTPLDERVALDLHKLILTRIDDLNAGRYRSVSVRISGASLVPPNPLKVASLMEELWSDFAERNGKEHPVVLAADLHHEITRIHPFIDGNGRLARLLLNIHLLQHGFPLTILSSLKPQRLAYYNALELTDNGLNPNAFRRFICEQVESSLRDYLTILNS